VPRIEKTPFDGIAAAVIDLAEGEKWDDVITVSYRRDEAQMLAVSCQQSLDAARDAIKGLRHAAAESNPDLLERVAATVTLIKFHQSARLLAQAQGALGAVIAPQPEREDIAIALADSRAKMAAAIKDEQEDMSAIADLVDELETVHNATHRKSGVEGSPSAKADDAGAGGPGNAHRGTGSAGGGAN